MKRRPWPLVLLALIHLMAPIGNIIVNSFLMNVTPLVYLKALLQPENLFHATIFLLIPTSCAVCIYAFKKWSYQAYIALMAVPFIYSFWSWQRRPTTDSLIILCLFYAVNVMIVGYFLLPNIRSIYFNPRLRWWETKPRYAADFQSLIKQTDIQAQGLIKNISIGGFFVESVDKLSIDQEVLVTFTSSEKKYEVHAIPVFHRSTAPVGYGFRVSDEEAHRSELKKLVNQLKNDGIVVGARAPGPEDTFAYWLKSLFTKSAWIPDIKSSGGNSDSRADLNKQMKTGTE